MDSYDYVVVGGGGAGAILAARLSESGAHRVCLIEAGPSDRHEPRALELRRWFEMLEGEYDLDYRSVPQVRGNSEIRHARAQILGGCTSHNTMIAFRPLRDDIARWAGFGADGWEPDAFLPYYDRLQTPIQPVAEHQRNPYLADVVQAASAALDIPVIDDFNAGQFTDGCGFFNLGYDPHTGRRSSSSVSYLHPVMDSRPNLECLLGTRALRIDVDGAGRATGVRVRRPDGSLATVEARREVVICAGAIDSPRLLLLSGIGPAGELREVGIEPVHDLPGVGANLIDHPEGLIVWEATRDPGEPRVCDWDAGVLVRTDPGRTLPDLMFHIPLMTYAVHAERLGYAIPERSLSMTPNVAEPRSRGRIWLESPDPDVPPAIDFRYLTDEEGYDERMLLVGLALARRVAATSPMSGWIVREVFPGPDVEGDELAALVRATHHTVYHASGTCRIGAAADAQAVVDPDLRVRGLTGLRVADASAFPTLTTVNPMVTVYMLAERAGDLILSAP
ncbi:MAG TPA: GMC family oxidoreductase [Thermoleophilia bacterium]|nr:GMC family oxidoreductase [Thermoleophilia bacterium]